jgi:hypothetical protein
MVQDRASWGVKGGAILHELVQLMDLSNEEKSTLSALKGQAESQTPALLEEFYGRLLKHAHTAEYLQGASLDRMHATLANWFADIFSGQYDEAYTQKRITIGQVHVRIGLPVRYPLAMMDVIMQFGEAIAKTSAQPDVALRAFRKVLALDIAIFNQAYEDNQLKHLSELVGGERLARRLLTGMA